MKYYILLFTLTLFASCSVIGPKGNSAPEKEKEVEESSAKKTDINMNINDIWALDGIRGEAFRPNPKMKQQHPQLEIHVADMRVLGNDGCNDFGGKIETLTDSKLEFGMLAGTKKGCPDMETPRKFNEALDQTRQYVTKNLTLLLLDARGNELLRFRKVD